MRCKKDNFISGVFTIPNFFTLNFFPPHSPRAKLEMHPPLSCENSIAKSVLGNKKGSHVGMILSFVIFVAFLIFLYSILEPSIQVKEDKQDLLDNLEIVLTEKFSADLEVTTFVINKATTKNCVRLNNFMNNLNGSTIIINNESGDIPIQVSRLVDNLFIVRNNVNNNFFKIYYSEEFPEVSTGNKSESSGKEIFESLINETKYEYENNYTFLKEELKIPDASDFGFVFVNGNTLVKTDDKKTSTSIYAEEIPILYVDGEANINSGFLTIKVW